MHFKHFNLIILILRELFQYFKRFQELQGSQYLIITLKNYHIIYVKSLQLMAEVCHFSFYFRKSTRRKFGVKLTQCMYCFLRRVSVPNIASFQ